MLRVFLAVLGSGSLAVAADFRVASLADFATVAERVRSGDTIIWAAGEYTDAAIRWHAHGEEAAPVVFRAERPGAVVFTGTSQLVVQGSWATVEGFVYSETSVDPIVLRDAQHCRVTACTFRDCAAEGRRLHYLRVGGKQSVGNRVDHCRFETKRTDGVMLIVDGDDGVIATDTRVEFNLFRGIEKAVRNGMEAIRVGDSGMQRLEARTLVENNRFEACRGDAEVVSNKSTGNTYRGNVFVGCDGGAIVLRHGDRCVVEGNRIDGENRAKAGGIRIHGAGHLVRRNVVERTAAFAIALPAGNSVPRETGHAPVVDVLIEENRVVTPAGPVFVLGEPHDSKKRQDTAPRGVVFRKNTIDEPGPHERVKEYLSTPGGVRWE